MVFSEVKTLILSFITLFVLYPAICLSLNELPIQYAEYFRVQYLDNGVKIVTDGTNRKILLVPKYKKTNVKKLNIQTTVRIPVSRVIVRWTTIPPLLKVLGVVNTVVGVTACEKDWYIKEIKERMKKGKTIYIGEYKSINYELLKILKPDVFFAGEWENSEILKTLNLPYAVVCEYREDHPLGRLEWIKFFAAFYNKEDRALKFFNNAVNKVKIITQKLAKIKKKPSVLWGFVTPNEMVYVPSGNSYVAKMIELAGGRYVFKDLILKGVAPISLEEFYKRGRNADIYISTGTLPSFGINSIKKFLELHPTLSDLKPVKNGQMFCFQPWYWESIDKTDEIIEDLASILHPEIYPDHTLKYFIKLPVK